MKVEGDLSGSYPIGHRGDPALQMGRKIRLSDQGGSPDPPLHRIRDPPLLGGEKPYQKTQQACVLNVVQASHGRVIEVQKMVQKAGYKGGNPKYNLQSEISEIDFLLVNP